MYKHRRVYTAKGDEVFFVPRRTRKAPRRRALALGAALALLAGGCGGAISAGRSSAGNESVRDAANTLREYEKLPPLALSDGLAAAARARAEKWVERDELPDRDEDAEAYLVGRGLFARFALSRVARGPSSDEVVSALTTGPLPESTAVHPSLTHLGVGFAKGRGEVVGVVYYARLADRVDAGDAADAIATRIQDKRAGNSAEPLELRDELDEKAAEFTARFFDDGLSSAEVLTQAQAAVDGSGFSLGRVTVTFQVAGDLDGVIVPERTSDPALAYAGLGVAQGNHPDHEPGSLAVMLFLAEPQTAHAETRELTDLPPPKAVPIGETGAGGGAPLDRAWVATLAGNHRRAAKLFWQAHQKTRRPEALYECARAHARNGDRKRALAVMREYAELVEGEDRERAEKLAAKLERGESIFGATEKERMNVEARRFFVIGQRLFGQGEWAGAIDAFQQAYTYAEHPDILYNIGLAHLRAGDIGQALDFFAGYQRAVPEARNVDEAKQLFHIGVELYRVGQFEAASRHFAIAYSYMPVPDLVYNLALCHKAMGDKDEALRLLREFLDSGPSAEEKAEVKKMIAEIEK
mgnify:CR=1 FL=1